MTSRDQFTFGLSLPLEAAPRADSIPVDVDVDVDVIESSLNADTLAAILKPLWHLASSVRRLMCKWHTVGKSSALSAGEFSGKQGVYWPSWVTSHYSSGAWKCYPIFCREHTLLLLAWERHLHMLSSGTFNREKPVQHLRKVGRYFEVLNTSIKWRRNSSIQAICSRFIHVNFSLNFSTSCQLISCNFLLYKEAGRDLGLWSVLNRAHFVIMNSEGFQ